MIVVKLMGGLGNQMFQYAIGRALSIKLKTNLILDTSFLESKEYIHTYRKYSLDKFNIKADVSNNNFKIISNKRSLMNKLSDTFSNKKHLFLVKEKNFFFDKDVLNISDYSYLDGYWQSFKYFESAAEQIRNDFNFTNNFSENTNEILQKINTSESVSIHVRRADYVSNKETAAFHGECSLDYYNEAIKKIKEKINDAVFFVFSDDMQWVKQNFKSSNSFFFVSDTSDTPHEDLFLMSSCKHAVTANSSFSWWGSWLISNSKKIVITPSNWFADSKINTTDLIPLSWLCI